MLHPLVARPEASIGLAEQKGAALDAAHLLIDSQSSQEAIALTDPSVANSGITHVSVNQFMLVIITPLLISMTPTRFEPSRQ